MLVYAIARVRLGSGKKTYKRGREALLRWRMHEGSSWARIILGEKPKRPNSQVRYYYLIC